jgi:acyl dehydratase
LSERMPINYDKLLALNIPQVEQRYRAKDCILYALALGFGQDPLNEDELAFVRGTNPKVLPTAAAVFGYPYQWLRDLGTGADWTKAVHGEQSLVMHRPMPAEGKLKSRLRVTEIIDKGAGKGAVIYGERKLHDEVGLLATLGFSLFCRGDGGFGGPKRESPVPHPIPERAPDLVCDLPTRPETALIYSLCGDDNPLHSDPAHARAAGFPRPILHGLASFGLAGRALLKTLCGYAPEKLAALAGRFSAPVYPGETVRTEIWRDGGVASFRLRVVERDVIAINNGRAEVVA